MNVLLIFTYGISLKIWEETGLLNREVTLYERLELIMIYNLLFLHLEIRKT